MLVEYPAKGHCYSKFGSRSKMSYSFMSVEAVDGPSTLKSTLAVRMDPLFGNANCLGEIYESRRLGLKSHI